MDGVESQPGRQRPTRLTSDRARVAVLAGAGLVVSFMQTLVVPIYPRLPELLDASPADVAWVLTSTLLAAVISIPITGRLGDMYGKRRALIAVLAFVVVGNIVAAFSQALFPLIIGRALQGVGIGAIPLGISILRDVINPKALGGAIALVSATLGVGGAVGLPIAGLVAQELDWHAVFWMGAALSGIVVLAVAWAIPPSTLRTGGRFDFPGAIGASVGLVAILLAVSKAAEWGWFALALAVGSVPVFAWWVNRELRVAQPFIDLRVAARRPVLLTNLASVAVGFSFLLVTAALPTVLESPLTADAGFGLDLVSASLCLVPLGLVMFIVSPIASRISARWGARTSLMSGIGVVMSGFVFGALLLDELWQVIAVSTVTGVGIGLAYAAMPTLIMRAVPASETAAANGLNSVMRALGSAISATLVGAILAAHSEGGHPDSTAFAIIFAVGVAVTLAGMLLAAFIPRHAEYAPASLRP